MVKILKIFIILARIAKFWGPDFISVEKIWFGAPVGPHRAPKIRKFKNFVFERRTAKI